MRIRLHFLGPFILGLLVPGLLVLFAPAALAHPEFAVRARIAPEPGRESIRFVVLADSQLQNKSLFERMAHEIELLQPDFVIQAGDMIDGYTEDTGRIVSEWREFARQIAPLTMPYFPVPGNHDVVTSESARLYGEVFGRDRYHYSFDYGPAHFVVLNTWSPGEINRVAPWQREWLRDDLAAWAERSGGLTSDTLANRHVFLFTHSPLWRYEEDEAGFEDWRAVEEILAPYPFRLAIAGHTHEHVWQQTAGREGPIEDGGNLLVMNTSGSLKGVPGQFERGGDLFSYLHVTIDGPEIHYATIRAGSIFPLDTIDSAERDRAELLEIPPGTIRLREWQPGESLATTVTTTLKNDLDEPRLYRLTWRTARGAEVDIDPQTQWIEVPAQSTATPAFRISSPAAPPLDRMPWLEIENEMVLRTGVVSRQEEVRLREDPASKIALEAPVSFSARRDLFLPPVVRAERAGGASIEPDGVLDEPAWERATPLLLLDEGIATRVRLLYDAGHLYIGGEMQEPDPGAMKRAVTGTEPEIPLTWNDDDIEFFFDPEQSQLDYWRLFQTSAGTRFSSKPRHLPDHIKYAPTSYESGITVGDDRWVLEMAVPWSDLDRPGPAAPGEAWSFNVGRHRHQNASPRASWSGGLYEIDRWGLLLFE